MESSNSWIVSQLGARQHYTVPLGFYGLGCLHTFYTDLWFDRSCPILKRLGGAGKRLAGRSCAELPTSKVVHALSSTLVNSFVARLRKSDAGRYEKYLRVGREFSLFVNRNLERKFDSSQELGFFGFNTASLETLQLLKGRAATVVDQIDPARTEDAIVKEEVGKWPGWQRVPEEIPGSYFDRLSAEWEEANVVLVNSSWTRNALIAQGVAPEKIAVAPIAYGGGATPQWSRPASDRSGPLRVLWLGQVNLRKGIPYLLEAARSLLGENVEFRVFGQIMISDQAVASAPGNVTFEGPIPRVCVADAYRWADVFILPTMSDGFAITQLEAMTNGLPVIATPNCGDVVADGKNGFLVPAGDSNAIASALSALSADRHLLDEMSEMASKTVERFEVLPVARQRLEAIDRCLSMGNLR